MPAAEGRGQRLLARGLDRGRDRDVCWLLGPKQKPGNRYPHCGAEDKHENEHEPALHLLRAPCVFSQFLPSDLRMVMRSTVPSSKQRAFTL